MTERRGGGPAAEAMPDGYSMAGLLRLLAAVRGFPRNGRKEKKRKKSGGLPKTC